MRSWKKNTSASKMRKTGAAALLIAMACLGGGASVSGDRWFEDVTARAGVAHKHTNRTFKNPYAHIMAGYTALGASAAVADYDGDGFDDVFVTDSKEDGKNRLYRNNGDTAGSRSEEHTSELQSHHDLVLRLLLENKK